MIMSVRKYVHHISPPPPLSVEDCESWGRSSEDTTVIFGRAEPVI